MANLYTIDAEIDNLFQRLDEVNEELETMPQNTAAYEAKLEYKRTLEDTIESLEYDFGELLEEAVKGIRNLEADMEAYRREQEYYQRKKNDAECRIKKRKAFIRYLMEKRGEKSLKAGNFTLTIKGNGGKTPITYHTTPEALPEQFRTEQTTYKADDAAIRAFLDAGGTSNLFEYAPRGTNLNIR